LHDHAKLGLILNGIRRGRWRRPSPCIRHRLDGDGRKNRKAADSDCSDRGSPCQSRSRRRTSAFSMRSRRSDNLGLERRVQLRQFLGERALLGCDLVVFRGPFPLARRPTDRVSLLTVLVSEQVQVRLAGHYCAWRTLIARQSSAISRGRHKTAPGETTSLSRSSGCALIRMTGA